MLRELAYAKLNLVLHVGRRRDDGMHPVCTLVASIDLADEVVAEPRESGEDTVECEGVPGDNLAARALAEFRSRAGKELPPLADHDQEAGAGRGRARRRERRRGRGAADRQPARGRPAGSRGAASDSRADLGSDVPSQLDPRHALVQGAGERIEPVSLPPLAAVLIPDDEGLSTGAVYAELDRIDGARERPRPGAASRA